MSAHTPPPFPLDVVSPHGDGAESAQSITLRGPNGEPVATVSSLHKGAWPTDDDALAAGFGKLMERIGASAVELAEALSRAVDKHRVALEFLSAETMRMAIPPLSLGDAGHPLARYAFVASRVSAEWEIRTGLIGQTSAATGIHSMYIEEAVERVAKRGKPVVIVKGRSVGATTMGRAVDLFAFLKGQIPGPSRVSLLGKNGKREKIDLPVNPNRRMRAALRAGAGLR